MTIIDTVPLSHTDTDLFEQIMTNPEDLKCQSEHVGDTALYVNANVCSGEVVAHKHCACGMSILICANSYRWNLRALAQDAQICEGCGRSISECWTVVPV